MASPFFTRVTTIIYNTKIDITFKNYDWTLDLDNWIEL
jgi:hypothetical protein